MDTCFGIEFEHLQGETNYNLLTTYNCTGVSCPACNTIFSDPAFTNTGVMLLFIDSTNVEFDSIMGVGGSFLYQARNSGSVVSSAASGYGSFGNYKTSYHSNPRMHSASFAGIRFTRQGNTTTNADLWDIASGGGINANSLYIGSINTSGAYRTHMVFDATGTRGQVPSGYTISMDEEASGGVSIRTKLNVGWSGTLGEIYTNNVKVIGARQSAVTRPVGGTVIDVECRAALNSLLTKLGPAGTGHGLTELPV